MFNEREDAAELKNLPIDDNMNGIIEEEEMEEEGSDNEEDEEENHWEARKGVKRFFWTSFCLSAENKSIKYLQIALLHLSGESLMNKDELKIY